jgi:hypothetical protein
LSPWHATSSYCGWNEKERKEERKKDENEEINIDRRKKAVGEAGGEI